MKVPAISVVMPCYNAGKFIEEAIRSILNQSFDDFEFIIVNDGSTDNSRELIAGFEDNRIIYCEAPENRGNYNARNYGMRLAKGSYIAVMDADDVANEHRLAVQYNYLESNDQIGCVGSQASLIDESSHVLNDLKRPLLAPEQLAPLFLIDNYMLHPSLMFRRALLLKYDLYYNEQYRYAADFDFINNCTDHFPVFNMEDRLMKRRIHSGQISKGKREMQQAFANQIRLAQLSKFNLAFNSTESEIYLKMLKRDAFATKAEVEVCIKLANEIIEANSVAGKYNQDNLHDLYHKMLLSVISKSKILWLWSIEEKMHHFIQEEIGKGKCILEFGSGNGTDELLKHYKVCSIEHNVKYVQKRNDDHTCYHAPINNGWYCSATVEKAITERNYDLILVDGPTGKMRKGILDHLSLFRDVQCPFVFDDVNRTDDLAIMNEFCNKLNYEYEIIEGERKKFAFCTKR